MKKFQKGFVPIVLIIIAVVVVAGISGYFVYKNKNSAPSESNQKIYKNNTYGFSFSYPEDFKLSTDLSADEKTKVSSYLPVCNNGNVTCLYYVGNGYENTNFSAAGISIERSVSPTKNECLKTIALNNVKTDKVVINGITFYHDLMGDAASGHSANEDVYRTYFNGACYNVIAITTETRYEILKDENPNLKQFDETALKARLKSIVSTFRFNIAETISAKETTPKPVTMITFNDGKVTFSYPSDRKVIWSRADGFGIGKIEKVGLNENTEYDISFTVDARTMDQIKKVLMYNADGSVNTRIAITPITLGGESGILYSIGGKPWTVYVPHNGIVYQVSISFAPVDVYSTFVSTFRFLN
jgi:ribosomal protein L13E